MSCKLTRRGNFYIDAEHEFKCGSSSHYVFYYIIVMTFSRMSLDKYGFVIDHLDLHADLLESVNQTTLRNKLLSCEVLAHNMCIDAVKSYRNNCKKNKAEFTLIDVHITLGAQDGPAFFELEMDSQQTAEEKYI